MQKQKSRNTWSNRQIWLWSMEWNWAKANRVLPRECIGHSKRPLPTTQEKTLHMDITRWSILKSDWLCSLQPKMEKLYTISQTRPGADCGSYHKVLIAKFRLKLKKVGKTARPFRYDLNQIPYDYPVLSDKQIQGIRSDRQSTCRTMDGGSWYVQEAVMKTNPKKNKCKKAKWSSEEILKIAMKRR